MVMLKNSDSRYLLADPAAGWQSGALGLLPVGCFTCEVAVREGATKRVKSNLLL